MHKRLLTLILLSALGVYANASNDDNVATDFMLTNNYNVRQADNIWQRIRDGFQINFQETSRVKCYERMYTKNQATFNKVMQNASIYLYYVLTIVERYGLPSELALIPIIESNYDTFAINSTGRYDGIWQFIPSTGNDLGLNENANINNRRDVVKATNAAMLYFNYLHLMFKQWDVAIGAYNWGLGNMYRAVLNSRQPLGQVDYTKLHLREITANYVPKIVALANIIKNPNRFGVKLIDIPNRPVFAITEPATNTTVATILTTSKSNEQTFKILNSQYKNTNYVINDQSTLLLPINNKNIYLASVGNPINGNDDIQLATNNNNQNNNVTMVSNVSGSNIPNDAINQIGYSSSVNTVASNSNLDNAVNVSYKNASDDKVNQLNNASVNSDTHTASSVNQTDDDAPRIIIPKPANTMPTPTKATDNQSIKVTNLHINNNEKQINQLVNKITPQKMTKTYAKQANKVRVPPKYYHVEKGDTLYSIANKFALEVAKLKHLNRIKSNQIKVGQRLVVR